MAFFLGFVLTAYLHLPLIALAVLGTILAVAVGMNDYQMSQLAGQRVAAAENGKESGAFYLDQEEEEFFS